MEKFLNKMEENFVIDTGNKEFQDALSLIQYTSQSVFLTWGKRVRANLLF